MQLVIKLSDTRASAERTKKILEEIYLLFGHEFNKNIIIIFTFVDDYDNIPALNVLKKEKSLFFKILGDINDLPYFDF